MNPADEIPQTPAELEFDDRQSDRRPSPSTGTARPSTPEPAARPGRKLIVAVPVLIAAATAGAIWINNSRHGPAHTNAPPAIADGDRHHAAPTPKPAAQPTATPRPSAQSGQAKDHPTANAGQTRGRDEKTSPITPPPAPAPTPPATNGAGGTRTATTQTPPPVPAPPPAATASPAATATAPATATADTKTTPPPATPAKIMPPDSPSPFTPTLPGSGEKNGDEAPAIDPTAPKLIDGRWILQPADPKISLYRIPPDANPDNPTTYAVTDYQDWKVACESRAQYKSCFASAYQQANQATIHIRIGAASRVANPDNPDYTITTPPIESGKNLRYVLAIQTPPQLSPQTQVTLTTDSAIGNTTAAKRCDKNGCYISFYTSEDPTILDASSTSGDPPTMTVTITIHSAAYVWSFPLRGLHDAIMRSVHDMTSAIDQNNQDGAKARLPH